MSLDAMKQALEALETNHYAVADAARHLDVMAHNDAIDTLRLAIEQAERQEPGPLVNIELSRRMAAVKVSNFYGSIIKDAEKEIQRLHGLVLQHTAPPQRQPLTEEEIERACLPLGAAMLSFTEVARAIERAHGIGGGE